MCVLGGYAAMGGKLGVLWQPFELVIILGAAIGAFVIANPGHILKQTAKDLGGELKGDPFGEKQYLELLSLLFIIFKRAKGNINELEKHYENPLESDLFQKFPTFYNNKIALYFLCDYLRLISLGSTDPHQLEALMDEELEARKHEFMETGSAMSTMADGTPALGIVAAVMGMIKAMGYISEPPEVLGKIIAGALVGTFLGVFLSYGYMGPLAKSMQAKGRSRLRYLHCIKAGLIAHVSGMAPAISIEYSRKILSSDVQPTFQEVEEASTAAAADNK